LSLKQRIQEDVKRSTYRYFKDLDTIFCDYIYGDHYYITLEDVLYHYLVKRDLDWGCEFTLEAIDLVELVSRLYAVFIKADTYYRKTHSADRFRHRKNYIMKALRRATGALVDEQYKRQSLNAQELYSVNHPSSVRYVSLDSDGGRLLEDLSWRGWRGRMDSRKDLDFKRAKLESVVGVLNQTERNVVKLVLENRPYAEISSELNLQQDRIRKVLFSAKKKLRKKAAEGGEEFS